MNIFITQNSFYFVHKNFFRFFKNQNSKIFFVKDKKNIFLKIYEIIKNFGVIESIKIIFLEIIWKIKLIKQIIRLDTYYVHKNELNQILEKEIKRGNYKRVISIGCPCKINSNLKQKYNIEMINLHGGITPFQLGKFSPIKSISSRHKYLGATIHDLSSSFDMGEIISQDYFLITNKSRLRNYNKVLKLSSQILENYLKNKTKYIPVDIKNYFLNLF